MREVTLIVVKRLETQSVAEHCSVPPEIAQRDRTGMPLRKGSAYLRELRLQPVASLQVTAILANRLASGIAGDPLERWVHLDDGVPSQTHVGDEDAIADMIEGESGNSVLNRWLFRAVDQARPLHHIEIGACWHNGAFASTMYHRANLRGHDGAMDFLGFTVMLVSESDRMSCLQA